MKQEEKFYWYEEYCRFLGRLSLFSILLVPFYGLGYVPPALSETWGFQVRMAIVGWYPFVSLFTVILVRLSFSWEKRLVAASLYVLRTGGVLLSTLPLVVFWWAALYLG